MITLLVMIPELICWLLELTIVVGSSGGVGSDGDRRMYSDN